ncbi:MAG: phosphatase PAP2 family protein [Bacilli bacterium]|nr:phosphatase PAP2 family protein [Bacilli bacterium]
MKKMRLHIYIAIGVCLVMIIIGSFLDLKINQALYTPGNQFAIAMGAISMTPGYAVIAFMGGVVLFHAHKINKVTYQRILIFIFSLLYLGAAIYFDAIEFFGENGWYNEKLMFVGYLIASPLMLGAYLGGYFAGKKANNPRLWLLMALGAAFIMLSLIVGTTIVKNIFHRPRFRIAVYNNYLEFYPWWQRCTNYKEYIALYEGILTKEEFKSFPSGHSSVATLVVLFVVILPFIFGKDIKNQVVYFYVAFAYAVFVYFSRMLAGAHYLSDVGMGGLITLVCLYIYYEIFTHYPKFFYEKPELEVAQ